MKFIGKLHLDIVDVALKRTRLTRKLSEGNISFESASSCTAAVAAEAAPTSPRDPSHDGETKESQGGFSREGQDKCRSTAAMTIAITLMEVVIIINDIACSLSNRRISKQAVD